MTSTIKVNTIQDSGGNTILSSDGAGTITQTASIGSFSSTGIDDNASSTAITINSSNLVGIGTTSPSGNLVVQASAVRSANSNYNQIVAEKNDNSGISILSGTTSQGGLVFGDADQNNVASVRYNHSADEMFFDVNGSRALTINSSGNFGIGTSSINVSGLEISRATGSTSPTPVELRLTTGTNASDWSTTSPYARVSFYSYDTSSSGPKIMNSIEAITTTTTGAISNLVFKSRTNKLLELNEDFSYFYTGNTERMRIDSSGNVLVGTTNTDPAFNNVAGQSLAATGQIQVTRDGGTPLLVNRKTSHGDLVDFRKDGGTVGKITSTASGIEIYLGGTGSANALDDYEEGTWTPVFLGGTGNPSVTYNTQEGRYTKIGNLVYVQAYALVNTTSGGSGNLRLGGLPFTAVNASSRGFASIALTNIESTIVVTQLIDPNSTYSILRKGSQPPAEIQVSDLANGEYLWYSGVYQTN